MNRLVIILIVGALMLVYGCSTSSEEVVVNKPYFSSTDFIVHELNRLADSAQLTLEKKVVINDREETKSFSSAELHTVLARDLEPFINADIALPAYRGEYDSLSSNGVITYRTSNEKRTTKLVQVNNHRHPTRLVMQTKDDNIIYQATSYLEYVVDSGFVINVVQKTKLGKEKKLSIEGLFKFDGK